MQDNHSGSQRGHCLKIIHFSTTHEGGAGLAARRLSQALNLHGVDSHFHSLAQASYQPGINEFEIGRSFFKKTQSFAFLRMQNLLTEKTLFSTYSSNAVPFKFFVGFGKQPGAVLHFHNWANLISQKNLAQLIKLGFKVVITLHDQRLLTGGCHYALDCSNLELGCTKCPRANRLLHSKIHAVKVEVDSFLDRGVQNLSLVAPSVWMTQSTLALARESSTKIAHVPNVLGPLWNPEQYSYSPVGRSGETVTIGVASNTQNSFVKASELVEQLRRESLGRTKNYRIIYLSDPNYHLNHSVFWREIDYLLALSRADNSPNVITEAKSLGIPIIASAVGGIPELVVDASDILVAPQNLNFSFLNSLLESLMRVTVESRKVDLGNKYKLKDRQSLFRLITVYERLLEQE